METLNPSSARESMDKTSVKSPLRPKYSFPSRRTNTRRDRNFNTASRSSPAMTNFKFFFIGSALSIGSRHSVPFVLLGLIRRQAEASASKTGAPAQRASSATALFGSGLRAKALRLKWRHVCSRNRRR